MKTLNCDLKSEKIQAYIEVLKDYNERTNVYSKSAYDHLNFHIQDSLFLAELAMKSKTIIDMGSGSGLPSAIMAIALLDTEVIAIESKSRKRAFLFHVKHECELENYTIFEGDVQLFTSQRKTPCETITAKAYKPPAEAWKDDKKLLVKTGSKSGGPAAKFRYKTHKKNDRWTRNSSGRFIIPISERQKDEAPGLKKAKIIKRVHPDFSAPFYYACFT